LVRSRAQRSNQHPEQQMRTTTRAARIILLLFFAPMAGRAAEPTPADCPVNHEQLLGALKASVKPSGGPSNGGLDNNEWAAVVARNGVVCAIAFSGKSVGDQWPASRAIAVEKANTANGMSLPNFAIATANLYAGVQPGGFLFGAQLTNPPNPTDLYAGVPSTYGTEQDPLVSHALGGVVVFGGGIALYQNGTIVGGLGASGDTSCADHNIAWRTRQHLGMDKVPAGFAGANDAIIYDIGADGKSRSGFGHPTCGGDEQKIGQEIGAATTEAKPPKHPGR
jgi:uncharacterized protein GlcG (DUF336 family)